MLLSVHAKPFEKLKLSKYFSLYTKTDELIYFCRIQQRLRNEWQAKKNKTRSFFLSLGYREVQFRSEKHHKSQIHGTTKSITSWEHRRQKRSRFLRVSLTSVFHAPVLLLIMKFRHNIIKVGCLLRLQTGPRGSTATLTIIISKRTDPWKTDVNFLIYDNELTHRVNYNSHVCPLFWQWKLANECARISAVIVKSLIS